MTRASPVRLSTATTLVITAAIAVALSGCAIGQAGAHMGTRQ